MKAFLPQFRDQVEMSVADGAFLVFALDEKDAKKKVMRWLKNLDQKDKQYFTGCKYPELFDIVEYPMVEDCILVR